MHDYNGGLSLRRWAIVLCGLAWTHVVLQCPFAAADGFAPPGEYAEAPGDSFSSSGGSSASGGSGPAMGGAPTPYLARNASFMDQSAYAMGKMSWNVVFLESNGLIDTNQENWTAAEINTLKNEIGQAKTFWEDLTAGFVPGARLTIDVHYANGSVPMATPYEPITRSSTQDSLWINSAMNALGYNSSNHFTNVRNYNNARRMADANHWATTIFIVDDTVDDDNRFSNGNFAYAYYNGPYTVLTSGNNGWGIDNFSMVMSHEMGHIFGALDEYQGSGIRNTQRAGYLNGLTLNASLDGAGNPVTPPQPNALMRNNGSFSTGITYLPHSSSSVNFGHRDLDSDGIPDILDTPATLIGDANGSNPEEGNFVFAGSISVNDYNNANPLNVGFSNSQADMTINTIVGMAYILNGGLPVPFDALDGLYNGYEEDLGFSILGLPLGLHVIDVVGFDSVGNPSNVLHFEFNSLAVPEPSSCLLAVFGLLGLMNVRRCRGN